MANRQGKHCDVLDSATYFGMDDGLRYHRNRAENRCYGEGRIMQIMPAVATEAIFGNPNNFREQSADAVAMWALIEMCDGETKVRGMCLAEETPEGLGVVPFDEMADEFIRYRRVWEMSV